MDELVCMEHIVSILYGCNNAWFVFIEIQMNYNVSALILIFTSDQKT